MDLEFWKYGLEKAGVAFVPGLTQLEIRRAEELYGLSFPPDLKMLLMFALPTGRSWPNWRETDSQIIEGMLNWPYEGMCFDIENNVFWPQKWGPKPSELKDCFAVAKQMLNEAPKLIPVYGHRYLPAQPGIEGNPVLSVYQTDIIYYGTNLWNYFQNEFHYSFGTPRYQITEPIRQIEFWSAIIDGDC